MGEFKEGEGEEGGGEGGDEDCDKLGETRDRDGRNVL
jgi:hypothetical protein